jgi:AraC-like DNA-binding protein
MFWFAARAALPHRRERGLPSGRVDIVVPLLQDSVLRFDSVDAATPRRLHGAVVSGAHDRYFVRGTGGPSSVIGVHFSPGGAAAFFGGALGELRNQTVLLEDLWGPSARELRERLQAAPQVAQKLRILEDALLSRLAEAPPADALVARALRLLEQDPAAARSADVRRAAHCSPQPFIRRFEAAVGLTPKRYARVLRFNALLSRLVRVGPRDWAQLAAEGGYFDQSHLSHEFKRLAGLTPAAYVPIGADQPTHVAIADLQA